MLGKYIMVLESQAQERCVEVLLRELAVDESKGGAQERNGGYGLHVRVVDQNVCGIPGFCSSNGKDSWLVVITPREIWKIQSKRDLYDWRRSKPSYTQVNMETEPTRSSNTAREALRYQLRRLILCLRRSQPGVIVPCRGCYTDSS